MLWETVWFRLCSVVVAFCQWRLRSFACSTVWEWASREKQRCRCEQRKPATTTILFPFLSPDCSSFMAQSASALLLSPVSTSNSFFLSLLLLFTTCERAMVVDSPSRSLSSVRFPSCLRVPLFCLPFFYCTFLPQKEGRESLISPHSFGHDGSHQRVYQQWRIKQREKRARLFTTRPSCSSPGLNHKERREGERDPKSWKKSSRGESRALAR